MKKAFFLSVACALLCCGAIVGCSHPPIKLNGTQSKVTKVIDGKTVQLQNGLKVELLGIKASEHTKKYLEDQVKKQTVTVITDSQQKRQTVKSLKTKVKAYLKVKGESRDVAGKMLASHVAELSIAALKDSLDSFSALTTKEDINRKEMGDSELLATIKPATFAIVCSDGSSGTGFYINNSGLAITNNHVWDGRDLNAQVVYFGDDGTINITQTRRISRKIFTYNSGKIDFTVFQVQIDPNEVTRYIPLAKNHARDGERVAKVGCAVGRPCNFQTGNLSNYNGGYLTHSCGTNHGDSGGPVVNFKGECIGVNQSIEINPSLSAMTGTIQKAEGVAYAVDATLIREVLDQCNPPIEYGR